MVRTQYVNDPPRVTGHVVYRAVVDKTDFPMTCVERRQPVGRPRSATWCTYPLRGGEQYNVVVTFHSRQQEEWGVTDGSKEEVESYFQGICPKARQLIELPKTWKRWATADREPIPTLDLRPRHHPRRRRPPDHPVHGPGRLHGAGRRRDPGRSAARHRQRLDQGARPVPEEPHARTGRIVLSGREMGRLYHAAASSA